MTHHVNGNRSAFPVPATFQMQGTGNEMMNSDTEFGMTLRQWYAGLAMQGILASDTAGALAYAETRDSAFEIADVMLDEPEEQS